MSGSGGRLIYAAGSKERHKVESSAVDRKQKRVPTMKGPTLASLSIGLLGPLSVWRLRMGRSNRAYCVLSCVTEGHDASPAGTAFKQNCD